MGLIPEDFIAQVLERSDIVETVGGYIPLKRAGRNFKAPCPFHNEKTPSFVVSADKQIFHCFGCGVGGNVINFVMKYERVEFPEAVEILAKRVGLMIPEVEKITTQSHLTKSLFDINNLAAQFFHAQLFSGTNSAAKIARDYLKGRLVLVQTVKQCNLGFAPDSWESLLTFLRSKNVSLSLMEKAGLIISRENREGFYDRFRNRIIFPIFDIRSRCLGFGARALGEDGGAKYINSPETSLYTKGQHLFGLHLAKESIREKDFVIVVEGYMDFLIPWQAGVKNLVASLGTALTTQQIRLLRRYTQNVVMLFDNDKAGEEATLRSLDLLIEEEMNVKVATLDAGDDPDSFVRKKGGEAFALRIGQAEPLFDYKLKVLMSRFSHKTLEGKAHICQQMLPMIRKFPNAVLRFGYVKQLAHALSIAEEALLIELQKETKTEKVFLSATATDFETNDTVNVAERSLLKLMLEEESHIPFVRNELDISDFQDERVRLIIEQMFVLLDKEEGVNASRLVTHFDESRVAQLISHLMVSEQSLSGDQEKLRRDYIERIKRDRIRSQRQQLSRQIRLAEMEGNHEQLDDLKQRFNQLIKG